MSKLVVNKMKAGDLELKEKVDKMADAAQHVIGDLGAGDTGFMFVVPVSRIYGLGRAQSSGERESTTG